MALLSLAIKDEIVNERFAVEDEHFCGKKFRMLRPCRRFSMNR